jgi:hypothetical protein
MRYRLAALMLMAVLLLLIAMNLPAAPRPGPVSAILGIGPPDKGRTADEHCEQVVRRLTHYIHGGCLWNVKYDAEVKELPSVARLKEEQVGPWLEKNISAKEENGKRRLRLTFRTGTRSEQVVILNALLHAYIGRTEVSIKICEQALDPSEKRAARYAEAIKKEQEPEQIAALQKLEADTRILGAPWRDEIARLKQIAVIKWAK